MDRTFSLVSKFNILCLSSLILLLSISNIAAATSHDNTNGNTNNINNSSIAYGISSNPATSDLTVGNGKLGKLLKLPKGIFLGGVWVANINDTFSGGQSKTRLTANNLLILNLSLDTEKLGWWRGGKFNVQFLQFNGRDTNTFAGSLQGINSLPVTPPFDRSELYQLWYRQNFFNDKVTIRFGKLVPTYTFDDVLNAEPVVDKSSTMPSVSGLLYTPIFINPTTIGIFPGYYNSAYGVTLDIAPTKHFYFSAGAYDGNVANGSQTGLKGPHFNGYYLYIGEMGTAWKVQGKPGRIAIGGWDQTGKLTSATGIQEQGTQGIYMFGSQQVWRQTPSLGDKALSVFFQLGANNSKTLAVNEYAGTGVTVFGMLRPKDSFGFGVAWAWLNHRVTNRSSELMLQAYYQAHIYLSIYLEPGLTYLPTPGADKTIAPTWAGTLQVIGLF